jgi:hypothetical protein
VCCLRNHNVILFSLDHVRPNWKKMMERSSYGTTRRTRIRIHHPNNQRRRQHQSITSSISSTSSDSVYDTNATMDLEDILVMEAIRLSLADGGN